jgi:hypothetical protein
MASAVLINGVNYSWSSLNNIAFGVPVVGILAINFSAKQVKENNHGAGTDPVSRGYGNKTYEGSITVYADWWMSVVNAAPNNDPLDIAPFDWTIAFGDGRTPFTTLTLRALEFTENNFTANQGDTKLQIDIPFIFAGAPVKA